MLTLGQYESAPQGEKSTYLQNILSAIPPPQYCWKASKDWSEYRLQTYESQERIKDIAFQKKKAGVTEFGKPQPNINNYPPRLESLERLLQVKNKAGKTSCLTWSTKDYQDVTIEDNSVIYCDIPYKNTGGYVGKGSNFDYERFYEWCLKQTQPLFISSYEMPENDFKVIAEFARTDTLSATNNSKKVIEKIFIPRTQDIKLNSQLNLF